jgi:hypothetical protein
MTELCAISGMFYDECDQTHEGPCEWKCGDCGGTVHTCTCADPPDWLLDPRRNGAIDQHSDIANILQMLGVPQHS